MERECDTVTRAILRHLGLPCDDECDKHDANMAICWCSLIQTLYSFSAPSSFIALTNMLQPGPAWSWLSFTFRLGASAYKGNALHHAARTKWMPLRCAPYIVALLCHLGCDFYNQPDSNGDAACLVWTRALGSHTMFYPRSLLQVWLERRNDPSYEPCEHTLALLQ